MTDEGFYSRHSERSEESRLLLWLRDFFGILHSADCVQNDKFSLPGRYAQYSYLT
jgi:hypothetical protein